MALEKGGVDASRIANDKAFIRKRENGAKFGSSARSGKMLRDTLHPMLITAADNCLTSQLTRVSSETKKPSNTNTFKMFSINNLQGK